MTKYYYIPKQHEIILKQAIDEWTSEPNYGWTIITGVYNDGEFTEGNSIIYNTLRKDRERVNIPLAFQADSLVNSKQLTAFTLEGDLDLYAPAFKSILMTLEGVLEIGNSTDYLIYLNSLNQL